MATLDSATKQAVQKAIGTMATSMFMTMAKLYLCSPNESEWRDTGIWGACCVIFDRTPPAQSRHVRIYEVESGDFECKFSQELYGSMQYTAPTGQFHTFEGQDCIVGLSFESPSEANDFMGYVRRMIDQINSSLKTSGGSISGPSKKQSGFFSKLFSKNKEPVEIGRPTDVVHKQHIGFDPANGFDCVDVSSDWAEIFKNAGIKKKDLKNPETAKIIYETLQTELQREIYSAPPPLPSMPPGGGHRPPPPLPPSSVPTPPPLPSMPPPTGPIVGANAPAAPIMGSGAPPAPPLSFAPSHDSHESKSSDPLAAQIQAGMKLRKVSAPTKDSALPDIGQLNKDESNTLASVLQKAMQARLKHVALEEQNEGNGDDEDWD